MMQKCSVLKNAYTTWSNTSITPINTEPVEEYQLGCWVKGKLYSCINGWCLDELGNAYKVR